MLAPMPKIILTSKYGPKFTIGFREPEDAARNLLLIEGIIAGKLDRESVTILSPDLLGKEQYVVLPACVILDCIVEYDKGNLTPRDVTNISNVTPIHQVPSARGPSAAEVDAYYSK